MTTVHIDRRGADIDIEGDRLVVRAEGERKGTLPLNLIDRLVISNAARLTTRLIARLTERGIGLVIDRSGKPGRPTALLAARPDRALRLAQYDALFDATARIAFSRPLVCRKIDGGLDVLDRIGASRMADRRRIGDARRQMAAASLLAVDSALTPDLSTLRGREGAAARAFFPAFASVFAPSLDFVGRNRRPPRDPVNVCLSLGYTLAHAEALSAAVRHGFDPSLGVYHDLAPGRDSLACDLVEPARPAVEGFVHRLFAEKLLRTEDFSGRGDSGCTMGKAGRREFYRAFAETCAPTVRAIVEETAGILASALLTRFTQRPAAAVLSAPVDGEAMPEVDAGSHTENAS